MDVKKIRESLGLTQEEFSQKTDIPRDRISKWEQGKGKPKAEDFQKITSILGKNSQEIVPHDTNISKSPATDMGVDPDNATLLRILDNLSAAHKEIAESNNKLAENEREILRKVPTAGGHTDTPSDELATLVGIREFVIELFADVKKTSPQEAEAVLGTKVVAAKKRVRKMGTPSGASK